MVVDYQRSHPDEFKGLTPEQVETKGKELEEMYERTAAAQARWLDEDVTNKRLDAVFAPRQVQPSIVRAKLHILPPGASMDLVTGEVPIYRLAKPAPK
jgi:hypothetical protein